MVMAMAIVTGDGRWESGWRAGCRRASNATRGGGRVSTGVWLGGEMVPIENNGYGGRGGHLTGGVEAEAGPGFANWWALGAGHWAVWECLFRKAVSGDEGGDGIQLASDAMHDIQRPTQSAIPDPCTYGSVGSNRRWPRWTAGCSRFGYRYRKGAVRAIKGELSKGGGLWLTTCTGRPRAAESLCK